jgi:methionine synthase I (cobalamin-dependent)
MAELEEARLALEAAKETGLPVVVCMTFDTGGRTMMGVSPEQAARELTAAGADAIGSNCGNGIAELIPITRQLRAATTLPLWVKPNAGIPELVAGKPVWKTSPSEFARQTAALRDAGATFIGGCCGTTPEHVRATCVALGRP